MRFRIGRDRKGQFTRDDTTLAQVLTEILMICDHPAVAIDVSSRNAGERMDMLKGIRRDVAGLIPEVKKSIGERGKTMPQSVRDAYLIGATLLDVWVARWLGGMSWMPLAWWNILLCLCIGEILSPVMSTYLGRRYPERRLWTGCGRWRFR